jgi:sulfite reductase alpha subunit-like flavoprotein
MASTLVQHITVLYGSQTGNSEQAAKDFCQQVIMQHQLKVAQMALQLPRASAPMVTASCMQLDDFLEVQQAKLEKGSRIVIIFVSSYGVGQAPLGSYRFRSVCDELLVKAKKGGTTTDTLLLLQGLSYAVCGLGDSTYPTYLQNPTTIDEALHQAGATRLLPLGKADAHQRPDGDQSQAKVIQRWVESLWVPLAQALAATAADEDDTPVLDATKVQHELLQLCKTLDPDFDIANEHNKTVFVQQTTPLSILFLVLGILMAVLAIWMGTTPTTTTSATYASR